MLIIVSNVAVDLLMDALVNMIRDVWTNVDVGMLVDVNGNVFSGVMTSLEFAMPDPLE